MRTWHEKNIQSYFLLFAVGVAAEIKRYLKWNVLKIINLINNIEKHEKNMIEENISQ